MLNFSVYKIQNPIIFCRNTLKFLQKYFLYRQIFTKSKYSKVAEQQHIFEVNFGNQNISDFGFYTCEFRHFQDYSRIKQTGFQQSQPIKQIRAHLIHLFIISSMNYGADMEEIFFQTKFQELSFKRDFSKYSFFPKQEINLDLEVDDFIQFSHLDLSNYEFPCLNNYDSYISEKAELQSPKTNTDQLKNPPLRNLKKIKNLNVKFYQKNICRNIIRKIIRSIENQTYKEILLSFCENNEQFYSEFVQILVSHLEKITGLCALKRFLKMEKKVNVVFVMFSVWYLSERYVRDAISVGHMNNIQKYISYKNQVLLPLFNKQ